MSTEYDTTYIAKNGFLTKEGWKFILKAAAGSFIRQSSIQGVRSVLDEQAPEPKILPAIWPFNPNTTCRKCGYKHMEFPSLRTYVFLSNFVKTECIWCGHKWLEKKMTLADPICPICDLPDSELHLLHNIHIKRKYDESVFGFFVSTDQNSSMNFSKVGQWITRVLGHGSCFCFSELENLEILIEGLTFIDSKPFR